MKIVGKRPNGELLALCERCGDRSGHMSVNIQKKSCFCFKCGYTRRLLDDELSGMAGKSGGTRGTGPIARLKERPNDDDGMAKRMIRLWPCPDTPMARNVFDYSIKRGVNPQYNDVYYSPFIPNYLIFKHAGWWQGRTILKDHTPKNLFPKDLPKDAMYIQPGCYKAEEIVLCEGIFDAISIGSNNYRQTIALLGSIIKPAQLLKLSSMARSVKRIIVFLDSDADEKAQRMERLLSQSVLCETKRVTWPKGLTGDPDEIGQEKCEELMNF